MNREPICSSEVTPSTGHLHQRLCSFSFRAAVYQAPPAIPTEVMCTEQILALLTDVLHLFGDSPYSRGSWAEAHCSGAPIHLPSICHGHSWHYLVNVMTHHLRLWCACHCVLNASNELLQTLCFYHDPTRQVPLLFSFTDEEMLVQENY